MVRALDLDVFGYGEVEMVLDLGAFEICLYDPLLKGLWKFW